MTSKRESSFKSHLTKEYLITNRIERNLSLRKIQVEQYIENKRFRSNYKDTEMEVDTNSELNSKVISCSSSLKLWKELQNLNCERKDADHYAYCLKSDDIRIKLQALVSIRKLLSMPVNPPIKEIISNETLVELFKIVRSTHDDRIHFEIIWIFVNIAIDYTHMLNENGIMDVISDLISRNNPYDLVDELVWLIANIAGDHYDIICHEMRRRNFHEFLLGVFVQNISSTINRSCLWALCNVLKGAKEINLSENLCLSVSICCGIISCYVSNKTNNTFKSDRIESFISNAISLICLVTDCKPCTLSILLQNSSAAHFMELLNSVKNEETFLSVLRVFGNFSANEHFYTDEIIKYNIFPKFKEILETNPTRRITKEVCWILSNIAAGLEKHVNVFFTTKDFLALLFKIFKKENSDVKKEVLWCICNLTTTNNATYMNCLVNYGIIEIFGEWLSHTDYRLPALIIEALDNIMISLLHHDITRKLLYAQCDSFGIIHKLQGLSHNSNTFLSNKSEELMNKYFLYFRAEEDLEIFDKEELFFCPGNDITDESEDIMPFITSVKNKEERNKENDSNYGNSNTLNDSDSIDYSQLI